MFLRLFFMSLTALCTLYFFSACSVHKVFLGRQNHFASQTLQEYCQKAGLKSPETIKGDSLMGLAQKNYKAEEIDVASDQADLASIYFRQAIAQKEYADQKKLAESLKSALALEQDRLSTYSEILNEMKAKRKP